MWKVLRAIFSRKKGCRVCGEPVQTPDGLFCSERHAEDYRYQKQYGW